MLIKTTILSTMKKSILFLTALGLGTATFAQKASFMANQAAKRRADVAQMRPQTPTPSNTIVFNYLDTLYYNDFSEITDFIIEKAAGSNGEWVFGDTSIGSGYLQDPFASTTADNGYAMFDSDGFNVGRNDAWFTLGPIDLSAAVGEITVNFEQFYARYQDSAQVWVSYNGTDFVLVGDNTDLPAHTAGSSNIQPNPQVRSYLLPDAEGQGTVWIRFRFVGDWDYTWLVDDLTITTVEVAENELEILNAYHGDVFLQYSYAQIPVTQSDSTGFTVYVKNNGRNAQTYNLNYEIMFNSASVHTGSASGRVLEPGAIDTVAMITSYKPTVIGNYTINFTVENQDDADPSNNNASVDFEITQYIYSPIPAELGSTIYSYSGGGPEYRSIRFAQSFEIQESQTIYGMQAAIARPSGFTGTQDFTVTLHEIDEVNGRPVPDIFQGNAIADYTMTTSHENGVWKTFVFDGPVELEAGKVYAASINYYGTDKPFWMFGVPEDFDRGTWVYGPFGAEEEINWWVGFNLSPAIRLNFDPNLTSVVKTDNGTMFVRPNPASDQLMFSLKGVKDSKYEATMFDINGRVVYQNSGSVSGAESIAVSGLANGVYTLRVVSGGSIFTHKVVVNH